MERQFEENDDMQIDLVALLKALKKKLWLIVICLIAGAAAFGIYTAVLVNPFTAHPRCCILQDPPQQWFLCLIYSWAASWRGIMRFL